MKRFMWKFPCELLQPCSNLATFFMTTLLRITLTSRATCNKIVTTLWYSSCEVNNMLQIHGVFKLAAL